ncbi:MAG: deoxyguanosinetriphosphate triphosphohydrolase, partial [Aestuariivirgaceae bacterium]
LARDGYLRTKFTSDLVRKFITSVQVRIDHEWPMLSTAYLPDDARLSVECLKHYTFEATIMAPRLRVAEARGYDLVTSMFERLAAPKGHLFMPDDFRDLYDSLSDKAEKMRVVSDFIAGMTDRYAAEFYGRIVSENPVTIFKPF